LRVRWEGERRLHVRVPLSPGRQFGFDDLRKVAVAALADIAANAVKADLGSLFGGAGGGGLLSGLFGSLFGGAPGRATGGPVAPGRPYMVGERGPELFVPTSAGSIAPTIAGQRGPVSITVNVAGPAAADSAFMARTGEQVARAVRRALDQAGS